MLHFEHHSRLGGLTKKTTPQARSSLPSEPDHERIICISVIFGTISPPTVAEKDGPRTPPGGDANASCQTYLEANQSPPRVTFWMNNMLFRCFISPPTSFVWRSPSLSPYSHFHLSLHLLRFTHNAIFLSSNPHRHMDKLDLTPLNI